MLRYLILGVCVGGFAATSSAQTAQQTPPTPPPLNPLLTTGTPVGTPVLKPVGTQFNPVGQKAGTSIGSSTPTWNQDPIPPGGQLINLKNSVAPVPMSSLPPVLRTQEKPSLFDQFYTKWATTLGLKKPDEEKSGYVPGMTRRAKERREKRWIWD
jgi:hypothetical protein